jgi:endonuclease YncB( thermonuclease family)
VQIYVHISGKNYGPYTIDQTREYVSKGSFKSDSQACYDGKNWVTISDIPGFVKDAEKPKQQTVPAQQKPKKKKKIRKVRLVVVSLLVFLFLLLIGLSIVGLINLMPDDGDESTSSNELFILTPDQIVDVYDGDTFKIDLPSMHPLFGDDLSIRLFGVDTPEMRGTTDEVKALAMQAQQVTEKALKGASKIELRNPQRGKYFRIISEVWIDGESLADMLKEKGLAKDYDGEGARPEW